MIKPELIQAGDVLYDVHRTKMATMSAEGCWKVRVIDVSHENCGEYHGRCKAIVSWNGNRPTTYYFHQLKRLRRKPKAGAM